MILAVIHPFGQGRRFIHELFPIERTYEILGSGAAKRTAGIDITDQDPLLQFRTLHRKLDQVRAFPNARMRSLSFPEAALIRPVLQIGRRIELHLLPYGEHHDPFIGFLMPEDFRVAEITLRRSKDRIPVIFLERPAVVQAIGHTLHLPVAGRGIESHDSASAKTGGIILIHHTATAEDRTQGIRGDRHRLMLPMNQVLADRMPPVHIPPHRAIRIVLIEQMILTILVHHAVRIIHPSPSRREMIGRTEFLPVRRIKLIG